MHYIFIDYENVQPAHLKPLMDIPCEVYIFVGALQNKLPITLVTHMQALGRRAKFIPISTSAKDALDFHIAFYAGAVAAKDRAGHFHILSNDKGYDPLIDHLARKGLKIERKGFKVETCVDISPAQDIQRAGKMSTQEKIERLKNSLKKSQPTTEEKLRNYIKNQLPISSDTEIQNLINCLRNRKIIVGKNGHLTYPALAA